MSRGILKQLGLAFVALAVPALAFAQPKKPATPPAPAPAPTVPAAGPTTKGGTTPATPTPPPTKGAPIPTTPTTKGGPTPGSAPTPPGTPAQPGQPQPQGGQPQPQGGQPAGTGDGAATDEPPVKEADVDSLRQEYLALRDELFKSRARANAIAGQLYSTRMTIRFTWGSARHYGVTKASIRLDGATVFEDATGAIASDDGVRFDGYVAPGKHLVTFHVEATGKDDDSFSSTTESQITVKAVANKDLVVAAKGSDSGDIAYAWKRSETGSYGLGIDVSVKSIASGSAKGKK